MNAENWRRYDVFLNPGEFFFGGKNARVKTILGSCVAVTLWHPHLHIGGMGHFMLPSRGRTSPRPAGMAWDGKYADEMMHLFMQAIRDAQTRPRDYEVKLFGGGNMFPGLRAHAGQGGVSARNVHAARALMAAYAFKVAGEHLGGDGHRSLVFDLADGAVYLSFKSASTRGDR